MNNNTQVTFFELSGLTDNKEFTPFLFMLFLLVYMMTICGNVGIVAVVQISSSLHTPMYYFLSYLSMVDLFYSSVVTPKLLSDLLSDKKLISFIGCALQFCFFSALASLEVFALSIMAYDRYIAICHPLRYVLIMSANKCLGLSRLTFLVGFMQSLSQTSCVFSLEYCHLNIVDHIYCDLPPLLKLTSSDTLTYQIITNCSGSVFSLSSLTIIWISYVLIASSILWMNIASGRRKAFSTCSSHLLCTSIFYITVSLNYIQPSKMLNQQNKVGPVLYTSVTPMLNPLAYSLRNQEIKRVIKQLVWRRQNKHKLCFLQDGRSGDNKIYCI
ncbi:olfactory receptor 5J3-like [Mantella aurantiaca]